MATREKTERETAPENQPVLPVEVSASKVTGVLLACSLALILAHLLLSLNYLHGVHFPGAVQLYVSFDAAGEVTVPTWFASSLLLGAALLCGAIAWFARRHRWPQFGHWLGLAVILLGLSIDEAADLHGAVSYRMSDTFDLSGPLNYPWVIPGAILTLIVGLLYLSFLREIDPVLRRRLLFAGFLYLGGALGMEVIQATYDSAYSNETIYALLVGVEEGMEMVAIAFLIGALLSHLAPMLRRTAIRILPLEQR